VSRKLPAVLLVVAAVGAAAVAAYIWTRRPPALPDAGISETLAVERASRVSALRYEVTFRIPAARLDPVTGHLKATFMLRDAERPLSFDFAEPTDRLVAMRANAQIIEPRVEQQHITVPGPALVEGENVVEFEFLAGDAPLNRGDEFLYALFVPARASLAMPVFDQPDLKARWRLILNVPPGWTAVSNGREIGRVTGANHVGLVFEETAPISTYLFAFAAGQFSVEVAERDGRTFRMLHRETDAAKVARNRDAVFDLHARAIAWLESYTGIPYPFGKFEFVLIPSFQFGGMEHPGAVYYNASGVFLDESATQTQMLARASLISHETSHMWFGDLVTMKWFNDVWMKEVFANFMAAKIVNPSFPDINHDLRFLFQHYPSAYDVDRTDGANPIRQPLVNLNEAGSLYGAVIYQKAPIVMRQLELLLGADSFRDGLREYLKAHAFGNATWNDLIAVLDARTDVDLVAWSRAWVEERGRPRIAVRRDASGGSTTVTLQEEDPLGRGLTWPQELELAVGYADRVDRIRGAFAAKKVITVVPQTPGAVPQWVLPTGGGLGYGDFVMDAADLEAVAAALPRMSDALTRGAALVTLWESMLEGRVLPARMLEVLMAALARETDELNTSQMLDYTRSLFWRFTAADDRVALASRLEGLLRAGLDRAATTSRKAAWFAALRSVAITPATVAWLESVWKRQVAIPRLPLAEPDEADLALELAVRDVPNAAAILQTQLERFKNADRRARFAFVMPALSSDAAAREGFFETLKNVANRRREAWVLESVRYLHHPLRAASSKKLVIDALGLVWEIQRTGDIFFPKRWADATLSGYQSPQTAADVRQFIQELPADYPPRLRWVLLASADQLFRAARILHQ
jgi:aminopeptidase N